MSAENVEIAKRRTEESRRQLESTLGALQQRLNPKTLASDAWEGVRDKSNDLADDALQAVKDRPATVSVAVGAFVLFLARHPLRRAVSHFFSPEDEGRITTRIDTQDNNYEVAAPFVDAPAKEGAM